MNETVQKITFQDQEFILTTPDDKDSPIATIEQFQKGECSYAHLYRDSGRVMRFRKQIGTINDIKFGERIEIEIDLFDAIGGLCGNTWPI